MYVPSNQRLLSLAVCSMLFLTGFRKADSSIEPEDRKLFPASNLSAVQPTQTSRSFSFEYKGLFYFKLSILPGAGNEGLLLDIGTNAHS